MYWKLSTSFSFLNLFFFFRFLCFRFSFRETLLPWRDRQYESYWAFDRIVNKVDISMIIY